MNYPEWLVISLCIGLYWIGWCLGIICERKFNQWKNRRGEQ